MLARKCPSPWIAGSANTQCVAVGTAVPNSPRHCTSATDPLAHLFLLLFDSLLVPGHVLSYHWNYLVVVVQCAIYFLGLLLEALKHVVYVGICLVNLGGLQVRPLLLAPGLVLRQQPRGPAASSGRRLALGGRGGGRARLGPQQVAPLGVLLEHVPEPAEGLEAAEQGLRLVEVVVYGFRVGLYSHELLRLAMQRPQCAGGYLLRPGKRPLRAGKKLCLTAGVHLLLH
mmetsp:Transcript_2287/g.6956  ORF Transcript_2287/g.6956 Transcript_2287/m.6956 type:complete len:228 (+) Transcript_2287:85-768(+)